MMWFLTCVAALIGGYFIYGAFIEKIFGINEKRQTPAHTKQDGVDFVPMSTPKVYLVQLLNIAGVGPIFGPIMGALYGPAAMLWIVLGCIFAGAVHDYFSGMLSIRNGGASVPTITGTLPRQWRKTLYEHLCHCSTASCWCGFRFCSSRHDH